MTSFNFTTESGQSRGDYPGLNGAIAKNHRSRVTVEDLDKVEISEAQRHWLHCKAGPIRELMRAGWSFRDAKEHIKVEYGRQWFVVELTPDIFNKIDGVFRWECRKVTCRKLIHPMNSVSRDGGGKYLRWCPHCGELLYPIAIKSIMDMSVKKIKLWMNEIFEHFPKNPDGTPRVPQPDSEWATKQTTPVAGS